MPSILCSKVFYSILFLGKAQNKCKSTSVALYCRFCIPANSHALSVSLTPAGWKLRSHAGSRLRVNFLTPDWKNVSCCHLAWHNFQKYVNADPCKERKPCEKWINDNTFIEISEFWSEKHWERACIYTRLKTSEDFGLLRETSEMIVSSSKIPALPG